MSDWLRIFEAKALAQALTEAGHSVSERTAQRWKKGETSPKPQDVRAIRQLVADTTKDAAPEGAAETLLRLWTGDQPPDWARLLVSQIIEEIHQDRAEAMTAMARRLGRMTAAELQELLSQLPDGSTPGASDQ